MIDTNIVKDENFIRNMNFFLMNTFSPEVNTNVYKQLIAKSSLAIQNIEYIVRILFIGMILICTIFSFQLLYILLDSYKF
jgi:hypothetical protein